MIPNCKGVSRMGDNPQALLLSFDRPLTDDEMRDIHEALRSVPCPCCRRPIPATQAETYSVLAGDEFIQSLHRALDDIGAPRKTFGDHGHEILGLVDRIRSRAPSGPPILLQMAEADDNHVKWQRRWRWLADQRQGLRPPKGVWADRDGEWNEAELISYLAGAAGFTEFEEVGER